MSVLVRPALHGDIDALASLSRILVAWHGQHYPEAFRADVSDEALTAFFVKQLADPDASIAIAERAGEPVGYIYFRRRPQSGGAFTLPRPAQIYVEHIAVLSGLRRQGVGAALMAYAEAQGSAGSEVVLETMSLNLAAQAFFARQGFVVGRLEMRKAPRPRV